MSAQERGESSEAREGTGERAPGLDRGPQGAAGTRPSGFSFGDCVADCSARLTFFTTNTSPDGSLPEISSQLGRRTKQNLFLAWIKPQAQGGSEPELLAWPSRLRGGAQKRRAEMGAFVSPGQDGSLPVSAPRREPSCLRADMAAFVSPSFPVRLCAPTRPVPPARRAGPAPGPPRGRPGLTCPGATRFHPPPRVRAGRHAFPFRDCRNHSAHSFHFMEEGSEAQKRQSAFLNLHIQLATKADQKRESLDTEHSPAHS